MKLYGYWRSGTSYRVRIALALKGGQVESVPVNLLEGEHREEPFRAINPQGLVPALALDDGTVLTQSPAIIEYLDETLPGPKLLPEDPVRRAQARQLAAVIGCDIHPIQNLRILKAVQSRYDQSREEAFAWAAHWIAVGFEALEAEVSAIRGGGPFCLGDEPSVPDCYLVPQMYAANRFGTDLTPFPTLRAIDEAMKEIPEVAAAHPDRQPDANTA